MAIEECYRTKWEKHEKKKQKHKEERDKHRTSVDSPKTISRNDKENAEKCVNFSDCQTIFVENRITLSTCRTV
jgi:hypothetical protein